MSEKNFLKIINHKNSRTVKQLFSRIETIKNTDLKIRETLLILSHNKESMIDVLEILSEKIGMRKSSRKKLEFLLSLKMYPFIVLRDSVSVFLNSALDRYDPKKGTKRSFFIGVLNKQKEKMQESGTNIYSEDNENDLNRKRKEFFKKMNESKDSI